MLTIRNHRGSSPTGAGFECRLDGAAFSPCSSPKSYKVKPGRHTFQVQAVATERSDPTPSSLSFKVVRKSAR
jgi:hypothetical protein